MSGVRVQSRGRTGLSTLAGCQFQVGAGEFGYEDAAIGTTLSCTDFKNSLCHFRFP